MARLARMRRACAAIPVALGGGRNGEALDGRRGDWMLWLLAHTLTRRGSLKHRRLVLALCACVKLHGVELPDLRIIDEVVERWAYGLVSTAEVQRIEASLDRSMDDGIIVALNYVTGPHVVLIMQLRLHRRSLAAMAKIVRTHFPNPPRVRR